MATVVTLHVYSGRANPSWILPEDQALELAKRIGSFRGETALKARGLVNRLGYRGFSISSVSYGESRFYINDGIIDPGDDVSFFDPKREVESWLLATGAGGISDAVRENVQSALAIPAEEAIRDRASIVVPPADLVCVPRATEAPPYNPGMWNNNAVRFTNKCYNYANDQITGTKAQPGRANGIKIKNFTCENVVTAAMADGLVPVPGFSAPRGAGEGWYVALAIWPGEDFHWYRQDAGGCWSHKIGKLPATDLDNRRDGIADPRACARRPYTDFCTFMVTGRGVKIR